MYTTIPYKTPQPIQTKVQAIKYIKSINKRYAKYANEPSTVKFIMNKHKIYATKELKKGLYIEKDHCWGNIINIDHEFTIPNVEIYPTLESGNEYGVCDDINNFLETFNDELENSNKKYFVCFSEIIRTEQPEHGGWRWHKWGSYIGKQTPNCEYIYDETDIDSVLLYHIYEITE